MNSNYRKKNCLLKDVLVLTINLKKTVHYDYYQKLKDGKRIFIINTLGGKTNSL